MVDQNEDDWGTVLPPRVAAAFGPEHSGRVFCYRNGQVSHMPEYRWRRPNGLRPGYIECRRQGSDEGGSIPPFTYTLQPYKSYTVCDCGPFLPRIFTDVDAMSTNLADVMAPSDRYHAVHFEAFGGISYANNVGVKHVASRNASWVGSLVPNAYRNIIADIPSQGLGGDLGIILGLMALTQRPGDTDDAFRRYWNGNRWSGQIRHSTCTSVAFHL
jgi:hypothetical protein